jgi:hypothetical protein
VVGASNTIERVIPSKLIAYEEAMVIGRLAATVTDSSVVLTGTIRRTRENEFRLYVPAWLRQLAVGLGDEEVSGFAADVFDRTLAHASLGEAGHVRFFPTSNATEPTLQAGRLLVVVADRIATRWPYRPDPWTPDSY